MKHVLFTTAIGCIAFALLVQSAPRDNKEDSRLFKSVQATIKENDLTCENYDEFCKNVADEATAMPSESVVIFYNCEIELNKHLQCI